LKEGIGDERFLGYQVDLFLGFPALQYLGFCVPGGGGEATHNTLR